MNEADFRKPTTPGRLARTSFNERRYGAEGQGVRRVEGLGYVPNDLPAGLGSDEVILATHDLLLAAERNLSLLQGLARRINNPTLLLGPLAQKEAQHSSAIEDTFASEEQLTLFDIDPTTVDIDSRPEVHEVHNYLNALRHGNNAEEPICLRLIQRMHGILMQDVARASGRAGKFRTTQNAIGDKTQPFSEAKFVPTPPEHLDHCLNRLERYIHTEDDMPTLVRFALVHYQFECIHPFDDGNGRLGRLLVALQLCKQGQLSLPLVYVSGFFERHRADYYRLLYRVSSDGAWLDWIRFFLSAIATQARDSMLRVERLDDLRSAFYEKVRRKRASAMLPTVVDALFSHPAITVGRVTKLAGMRAPSAGKLIRQLEDLGIVREATGRKHYRVFVADDILKIMSEDLDVERSQPPPQTPPVAAS